MYKIWWCIRDTEYSKFLPLSGITGGRRALIRGQGSFRSRMLGVFSLHTQLPPCNLPEGSLLVRIQFPYSLPVIGSLSSALDLQVLYKPSTSLSCHLSPWRWRQHVSPKRRYWPANTQGAKTQDFYNNTIIITVRTSNLIYYFSIYSRKP
jgi:hypothetical protein